MSNGVSFRFMLATLFSQSAGMAKNNDVRETLSSNVSAGCSVAGGCNSLGESGVVSYLAALPTQRSESSQLCVLGELFKVRLPLPISGRV